MSHDMEIDPELQGLSQIIYRHEREDVLVIRVMGIPYTYKRVGEELPTGYYEYHLVEDSEEL